MSDAPVQLIVQISLPLAQVEPLLAYLRAYPGDPDDAVHLEVTVDLRDTLDRPAAMALLQRLGLPVIVQSRATGSLVGYPAEEISHA